MARFEETKYVSMDMREQIFDLLRDRMNIADNQFTSRQWELCLYECMNIQSKIDRLIYDPEIRRLIDTMKEKILTHVSVCGINAKTVIERNRMIDANSNLPILLDWYKTTLNNLLFDAGILYPIKLKHNTMLTALSDENFGMDNEYEKDYIKVIKALSKEEIIGMLPKQVVEDLYVKVYIKDVLQE